jgi:hypothetical protein
VAVAVVSACTRKSPPDRSIKKVRTEARGDRRPALSGLEPSWGWILKEKGCAGAICARQTKGAPNPLPHIFAAVNKGKPEQLYRAWVKRIKAGKKE